MEIPRQLFYFWFYFLVRLNSYFLTKRFVSLVVKKNFGKVSRNLKILCPWLYYVVYSHIIVTRALTLNMEDDGYL